ncbi:hypothetical protein C8Q76DRAFT_796178 [Earliella scabrosa]|nr:hypothetical protein C8Q76DRAFT_796178 [Earliella scabrosa]
MSAAPSSLRQTRRATAEAQVQETSARAIRRWNKQVREETRLDPNQRMVKALLYPVGDTKPRIVYIATKVDRDDDPDAYGWAEDYEIDHWFPSGKRFVRMASIPATRFTLDNEYTMVSSLMQVYGPLNQCLHALLGLNVHGNLLVIRHSALKPETVINIHPAEKRLVDLVVFRRYRFQVDFSDTYATSYLIDVVS